MIVSKMQQSLGKYQPLFLSLLQSKYTNLEPGLKIFSMCAGDSGLQSQLQQLLRKDNHRFNACLGYRVIQPMGFPFWVVDHKQLLTTSIQARLEQSQQSSYSHYITLICKSIASARKSQTSSSFMTHFIRNKLVTRKLVLQIQLNKHIHIHIHSMAFKKKKEKRKKNQYKQTIFDGKIWSVTKGGLLSSK